jgi:hypothetical protein
MSEDKRYKFLSETSSSDDDFEDKTHQKIAHTIYNVIQSDDSEGMTIGLEGGWGSGKSTVVSILRDKLKLNKIKIIYFYFDAWEHEGDPLRRIFLEALINEIIINNNDKIFLDKNNHEKLENIKKKISYKEKIIKTSTKRTATRLGKYLAIATFIVPIGVAIVSGIISKFGLYFKGNLNWELTFGFVLSLAPIIVLLDNLARIRPFKKENIRDPKNWMFLQSDSEENIHQEESEDNERTSIEFQKYFYDILEILFSINEDFKLLIVIDNLDRIDAKDSLKIWSTLQTFLQNRNPHIHKKYDKYSKRIFVLVPYDEEGLEKLWENNSIQQGNPKNSEDSSFQQNNPKDSENHSTQEGKDASDDKNSCAKSFFDKCFQLRIGVPKFIPSAWESFCEININKALTDYTDSEKKDIIDVLRFTRVNIGNIPTPREIKTYINQIKLIRLHCDINISVISIAYFVVQKYLNFLKNGKIEDALINKTIPFEKYIPISNDQLIADLCGILFGVSSQKGQQLLLEPEMKKAFTLKDIDKLKDLSNIHKTAFWTVLSIYLPQIENINLVIKYSNSIWNVFKKTSPDECQKFAFFLKDSIDKLKSLEFPTNSNIEDYEAAFMLLDFFKYDSLKLWDIIINSLEQQMNSPTFNHLEGNEILSRLIKCQNNNRTPRVFNNIALANWEKWAEPSIIKGVNSYDFVQPHDNIINELAGIQPDPSISFPSVIYFTILYLIKCGKTKWDPFITSLDQYIKWPNRMQYINIYTIYIFETLILLSLIEDNRFRNSIRQIMSDGFLFHVSATLNAVNLMALIMAINCAEDFDSFQTTPTPPINPDQGINEARNYWKTSNDENSAFVWNKIKSFSYLDFIWSLSKNKDNKLIGDIIKIAVHENHSKLFSYLNSLQLLNYAISITGNEEVFNNELTKCFLKYSPIREEIFKINDSDFINFSYELYYLINNSKETSIINHLANKIKTVTKEQWNTALLNDTYLTTLAIIISEKLRIPELLTNNSDLYEPLLSYLQKSISNGILSEKQQNELPELVSLLNEDFRTQLENRLADYITENQFKGSPLATSYLLNNINIKKIIKEYKSKIENIVDDAINKSKIEDSLRIIDVILSHQDSAEFKPEKRFAQVFKDRMKTLLRNSEEEKDKEIIKRLASKFGVDLSKKILKSNDIKISLATYGTNNNPNPKDITSIVQTLVNELIESANDEQISFKIENDLLGGDPELDKIKELKITYSYLGKEFSISIPERINDIISTVILPKMN